MANPVQDSFLWTTSSSGDGSATYTQADWTNICKILGGAGGSQGVVPNYMNCYSAACETGTVIINTGGAIVDGKPHLCSTAGSVAISAPVSGTRIDRITLRAMWNAGDASPATVRIYCLAGSDPGGAPTVPAMTQVSGSTWDVPLYNVTINTASTITALTDERYYSSCGMSGCDLRTTACGNFVIADDAVDDTKVGNRVVKLTNRQGGNASNWSASGTTTYVPTTIVEQVGAMQVAGAGGATVTFPVAFSNVPIVSAQVLNAGTNAPRIGAITATTFTLMPWESSGTYTIMWRAIGPE